MCDDESDARKSSSCDGLNYQSVPDADREMAAQALHEFEHQKYGQSLSSMKKLLSKRPLDSKVFHNTSVVEFYLSNCKKTEQFNKKMLEICKQAHIDVQDLETLDDVDNCVVLYNQSVVLFHLHQYHAAISILDKVFQFIEPLEEKLARNICFLLLECCLSINQLKKAVYLIGYLEAMIMGGTRNSNKANHKEKDNQKDENSEACVSEAVKRKLQLCKARCYAMMKTSKACKREIKNLMSSGTNVQNIPAFYLKSQLEYQRGNYRKALKLLNSVTLPEDISKYFKETGDCLPAIFYNNVGCIHFYMGKPNLGAFYMEKALQAFDTEIKSVTSKADTTENKLNCRPLHQMSISTRHQLLYNLGMQFFQAKKFNKAFDCFVEAVKSFHSNPRLWLRIAECCIQINKPDCLEEYHEYKGKPFVKSIVGVGPHRKVIMNSASEKATTEDSKSSGPGKNESPSMQFAMLCLKNALYLVGEYSYREERSDNNTPPSEDGEEPEYKLIAVLPSNSVQDCDAMYLRNSIIVSSAYVALCLGDVLLTLEYTHMINLQPMISGAHKFFAHMYAGEALLIMDRITNAVDNFNLDSEPFHYPIELTIPVANSPENSLKHQARFDLKYIENMDGSRLVGNLPKWFPDTISTSTFVSNYNLAVAYAVREEWSKALESLLQINPDGPVPPQAMSLLMYIHCHQGSADDINIYVKQYPQPVKQ